MTAMPTAANITDLLEAELALVKQAGMNRIGRFFSMGEFVLKHGREFTPSRTLPKDMRLGKLGHCFENAAKLAIDRACYTYCEGYAMGIIPVLHAWCVDENGVVVDPTWTRGNLEALGMVYFGVAFNTKYLIHHLCEHEKYGLIDAWEARWPLLRIEPSEFLHPKFAHDKPAIH